MRRKRGERCPAPPMAPLAEPLERRKREAKDAPEETPRNPIYRHTLASSLASVPS
jgi:hypothetical protein